MFIGQKSCWRKKRTRVSSLFSFTFSLFFLLLLYELVPSHTTTWRTINKGRKLNRTKLNNSCDTMEGLSLVELSFFLSLFPRQTHYLGIGLLCHSIFFFILCHQNTKCKCMCCALCMCFCVCVYRVKWVAVRTSWWLEQFSSMKLWPILSILQNTFC